MTYSSALKIKAVSKKDHNITVILMVGCWENPRNHLRRSLPSSGTAYKPVTVNILLSLLPVKSVTLIAVPLLNVGKNCPNTSRIMKKSSDEKGALCKGQSYFYLFATETKIIRIRM